MGQQQFTIKFWMLFLGQASGRLARTVGGADRVGVGDP